MAFYNFLAHFGGLLMTKKSQGVRVRKQATSTLSKMKAN